MPYTRIYTLENHDLEMPDCDDPDCEFHCPEVLLDEGWDQEEVDQMRRELDDLCNSKNS